jgi:hypothetical protein
MSNYFLKNPKEYTIKLDSNSSNLIKKIIMYLSEKKYEWNTRGNYILLDMKGKYTRDEKKFIFFPENGEMTINWQLTDSNNIKRFNCGGSIYLKTKYSPHMIAPITQKHIKGGAELYITAIDMKLIESFLTKMENITIYNPTLIGDIPRVFKLVRSGYGMSWELSGFLYAKKISDIFIPHSIKDKLVESLKLYIDSNYIDLIKKNIGNFYNKIIILHGPPGYGKTTTIYSLARHINYNLYIEKLAQQTSEGFVNLFDEIPAKSIILFEDIDTHFSGRSSVSSGVDFSDFINQIEKISTIPRIIFITTNKFQELDEALIRRADHIFKIDTFNSDQMKQMYKSYWGDVDRNNPHASDIDPFIETTNFKQFYKLLTREKLYPSPVQFERFIIRCIEKNVSIIENIAELKTLILNASQGDLHSRKIYM